MSLRPNEFEHNSILAAAYIVNGQIENARRIVEVALGINPNLGIDDLLRHYHFPGPEPREKLAALLERAGFSR